MRREESDVVIPCNHKRSARLEYSLFRLFLITLCISSIPEYGPESTQCVTAMERWFLSP